MSLSNFLFTNIYSIITYFSVIKVLSNLSIYGGHLGFGFSLKPFIFLYFCKNKYYLLLCDAHFLFFNILSIFRSLTVTKQKPHIFQGYPGGHLGFHLSYPLICIFLYMYMNKSCLLCHCLTFLFTNIYSFFTCLTVIEMSSKIINLWRPSCFSSSTTTFRLTSKSVLPMR